MIPAEPMISFKKLCLLFLTIVFISCSKYKQPKVINNESYGDDEQQIFDIYLPANRDTINTPILFLIHGGGWTTGSKQEFDAAIPVMRETFPTYAIATIGYRLCVNGTNRFPTQEIDVRSCIEFVVRNKQRYGVSDKFALWGTSAGAQLALMYAYKNGKASLLPRAVIEFAAPTDLVRLYHETPNDATRQLLRNAAGLIETADSLHYHESSPVNYVSSDSPPTMIIHGDLDKVIHFSQAQYLKAKLEEYGVEHEYKVFTGEGHFLSPKTSSEAGNLIYHFLNEKMKD